MKSLLELQMEEMIPYSWIITKLEIIEISEF
jgi:hypothetical protein